ncbi:alpha/beta hydrolase [Actinomadura hibisca]|uniref:alpha/beta hydrolase n=1 Tax=Actinomadura hibisca TaxID=68565 RepID=UPI000B139210|nr:alpha/beta hydrolase [Actinomadura hibisca]
MRSGTKTGTAAVGALALAVFGLAGCGGGDGERKGAATPGASGGTAAVGQKPSWDLCRDLPKDPQGKQPTGFQCATVKVPLDYAKPDGETIDVALLRAKATGPGPRIGSLLFNFGGPGGAGVDTLAQTAAEYRTLNTRYDLIGFDPRGVGRSAPVTCFDDKRLDAYAAMDGSPDDAAEEKAMLDEQRAYNQTCQDRSGKVLPYVGTLSAARDMDVIRTALGDSALHYFGISYGTWLGGNYAHQMPKNVGRAVLDGAVDTKISGRDLALQQAAAFQRALGNFASACAQRGAADCPIGSDRDAVVAAVDKLLKDLDAKPLPTGGDRQLTQSLAVTGIGAALYSEEAWPYLIQGLAAATERSDGSTLLALADLQNGREPDGHYANLRAAHTAISCADTTERYTVQDVREQMASFRKASPTFGESMAWGLMECTGWPVRGDDAAQEVSAPDAAPIVVVGNIGDPATPYAWAPALTKELGGRATLLTLDGQGHGAYNTGNKCVQAAVDDYLLNGKTPAQGARCR